MASSEGIPAGHPRRNTLTMAPPSLVENAQRPGQYCAVGVYLHLMHNSNENHSRSYLIGIKHSQHDHLSCDKWWGLRVDAYTLFPRQTFVSVPRSVVPLLSLPCRRLDKWGLASHTARTASIRTVSLPMACPILRSKRLKESVIFTPHQLPSPLRRDRQSTLPHAGS
jgi:hypothetical protein